MESAPIETYSDLIAALRAHVRDIDCTLETVDTVAGFTSRYSSKLIGPNPIRNMSAFTLLNLCGALGLRLTLSRDDQRLELLRKRSQWAEPQRNGRQYRLREPQPPDSP
jgi:hypothetical protein